MDAGVFEMPPSNVQTQISSEARCLEDVWIYTDVDFQTSCVQSRNFVCTTRNFVFANRIFVCTTRNFVGATTSFVCGAIKFACMTRIFVCTTRNP